MQNINVLYVYLPLEDKQLLSCNFNNVIKLLIEGVPLLGWAILCDKLGIGL